MKRHVVLVSANELKNIISGREGYLVKFFKRRVELVNQIKAGDLVFLKKGNEVLAQFSIGKVVLIEGLETKDFEIVKKVNSELSKVDFEEILLKDRVVVIARITKLEQFITSPIETPKGRKEWLVLESE